MNPQNARVLVAGATGSLCLGEYFRESETIS